MGEGEIRGNGVGRTRPDALGLESLQEKIRTHGHRMMAGGDGYPYAGREASGKPAPVSPALSTGRQYVLFWLLKSFGLKYFIVTALAN